jgi:hypothetical protein
MENKSYKNTVSPAILIWIYKDLRLSYEADSRMGITMIVTSYSYLASTVSQLLNIILYLITDTPDVWVSKIFHHTLYSVQCIGPNLI